MIANSLKFKTKHNKNAKTNYTKNTNIDHDVTSEICTFQCAKIDLVFK